MSHYQEWFFWFYKNLFYPIFENNYVSKSYKLEKFSSCGFTADQSHLKQKRNEIFNWLASGRFDWNLDLVVFKLILMIDDSGIPYEIFLR